MGAAVQPDIKLKPSPAGSTSWTVSPGTTSGPATETEKKLTFVLEPAQERYVRLKMQMGILVGRVVPEIVDRPEALKDLDGLIYIASPLN